MDGERRLLQECHLGDKAARELFKTRSYLRSVQLAVRLELETLSDYSSLKIDDIAVLCTTHIYGLWYDIPASFTDLHTRIQKAAAAFARNYWKADVPKRP